MKDHLITLGLALAALALFWLLLFPKAGMGPEQDAIRYPLSGEPRAPGYLGLMRWLQAERVPALAWRSRFERLLAPEALPAARGNVLVTTMPHALPLRRDEFRSLAEWLERGNTLFIAAALADTPRWSAGAGEEFVRELVRITRLKVEVIPPERSAIPPSPAQLLDRVLEPTRVDVEPVPTPADAHWLFAGVDRLATVSELPASRWRVIPVDSTPLLELARRADTGDGALWQVPSGRGTILLSAFASPWSNGELGNGGNARFLANLLAHSLGPGGSVVLDDSHQNAVDYYDPKAFFADPRLRRTLAWIVLGWLLLVVGARPLAAAVSRRAPLDDAAMLRLTARFYASALSVPVSGQRLLAHFFNSIRRRLGRPESGAPVWDWLDGQARVPPAELAELRQLQARAESGRTLDLVRLQSLIATISGRIA